MEKLYTDAKERIKKKNEDLTITFEEPYDRDNIASESSKYIILEKFVKSFELCVLNLFSVKDNHLADFKQYSSMLYTLGFVKFEHLNQNIQITEEKKVDKLDKRASLKKSISRGISENSADRIVKKVDKELKIIKESWKFLSKNKDQVNTNQILVFLSGILGLYDGEKPLEIINNIVTNIKLVTNQNIRSKIIKIDDKKMSKSVNKNLIQNKFQNNLKNKNLSKSINERDLAKSVNSKSEEKKKNEILLKKVIPELDLTVYSYSFKVVQYLKFFFRHFYDNRMNYLLHENRKMKTASQNDLIFKPKLNTKTLKSAENYRKKCFDVN